MLIRSRAGFKRAHKLMTNLNSLCKKLNKYCTYYFDYNKKRDILNFKICFKGGVSNERTKTTPTDIIIEAYKIEIIC